ncbi:divalent-cation tolerance protein CutA [Aliikangiella coralliicola]|uniref:Divalent-cation tolerance protein CutA n=1 Tax=Aliikangiella coralliicola TaxID=2592383 RepID=A0A545UIA7_9GAMM|nr:divalent-cation tolerance protein CutA [Aliikangiella coralliicola]TQV89195.1 divalent-cation tolerance protein CutA [Aliikangiella coralliicola]
MDTSQFKLCLTTVGDKSTARQIARSLLQQKLVACVNISAKMTSLYHWDGDIAEDDEFLLLMKTSSQKVDELRDILLDLHPYDVPEFIVLNIKDGASEYLTWINSALS